MFFQSFRVGQLSKWVGPGPLGPTTMLHWSQVMLATNYEQNYTKCSFKVKCHFNKDLIMFQSSNNISSDDLFSISMGRQIEKD